MAEPTRKKSKTADAESTGPETGTECPASALTDSEARGDLLNRLKRAEGQLRGIQRMIEDGDSCLKISQQFSAVRKALDSTYLRMTVCFMAQEIETRLQPADEHKAGLEHMLKDVETLLARLS